MLRNLVLERPIAFIDVETTGLRSDTDRIVELSILKIFPDGTEECRSHRMNPGIPIPPESSAIHGIRDEDVKELAKFDQFAKSIKEFLDSCDIAGFNVIRFDIPFLEAEFQRSGMAFSRGGRQLIDSQVLFHLLEPRDLKAAYRRFCGKELKNAHTADGDATAAAEILNGQLECFPELPRNVADLCALCNPKDANYIDQDGKFIWAGSECVCNFGRKHNGRSLREIAACDPTYLMWIAQADFTAEVKKIVTDALSGQFPSHP